MSLSVLLIALLAAPPAGPCRGHERMERTTYQMGTLLRVRVEGAERGCAAAALEAAFVEVARLEKVLSSWTSDSEIGQLNAAEPGGTVQVSAELAGLLKEAGAWVSATGGAFDPAVGALIDAWQLRGAGRVPSASELAQARAAAGWAHMRTGDRSVVRGPAGWWVDTGAFGKGAALRSAAAVLRRHGIERAVLDFGGQLLLLGEGEVGVAHPSDRDVSLARVRARDASIATSSASERFVEADGRRLGHVLDPRSGAPVEAWGSVTVLAKDALEADALSTALFVMGRNAALAWAAERDVGVLVLWHDGDSVRAEWNAAMDPHVVAAPTVGRVGDNNNRKENLQ